MHVYHQELAAAGWAVLLVNPRGSDGYGAAFYDGVQGAWGVADHLDFLEPIDALVAEGLAGPLLLPRADRRSRRRGSRRPGPARGHRVQLRRVHDRLADGARRPVQ